MITRLRALRSNTAASTDNAASIQLVKRGLIVGVNLVLRVDSAADNESYDVELCFFPTFQSGANDGAGIIAVAGLANNFVTSGLSATGQVIFVSGIAIPVDAGTRLYLNTTQSGGTFNVRAVVHIAE